VGTTHPGKNVMTTSRPLELLHMDLIGSVTYLSITGSKYDLVIVDNFSRFIWVFFLQDKIETQSTLKCFLRRAQNEFKLKVKKIRSDNGSEFKNLQVEEFLVEDGIKHEFFAPYTPQQNGVVGRKNRTLIDLVRTMLGEYKKPERRDVIWFGKYPSGSGFEDGEHWFGWNFRISRFFSDNGYEYGYFVRISNSNTICLISVGYRISGYFLG
jgi:transposase InsO family protein